MRPVWPSCRLRPSAGATRPSSVHFIHRADERDMWLTFTACAAGLTTTAMCEFEVLASVLSGGIELIRRMKSI
jgi:hypothetical protein